MCDSIFSFLRQLILLCEGTSLDDADDRPLPRHQQYFQYQYQQPYRYHNFKKEDVHTSSISSLKNKTSLLHDYDPFLRYCTEEAKKAKVICSRCCGNHYGIKCPHSPSVAAVTVLGATLKGTGSEPPANKLPPAYKLDLAPMIPTRVEFVRQERSNIRSLGRYNNTQKKLLVGEGEFSFSAATVPGATLKGTGSQPPAIKLDLAPIIPPRVEFVRQERRNIRSLGPYNNTQKILLVGEGDFSFSASLATAFGSSASDIIATSLNPLEFLLQNYKRVQRHLSILQLKGSRVFHRIDATVMARHRILGSMAPFDRVVYNFPHSGIFSRRGLRKDNIKKNQELVRGFLANAKEMIKADGEIHITHKCNGFHLEWRIEALAQSQGLRLLEDVPFRIEDYPGYETKYGFGGDKNFDCNPCKTYKFVPRERLGGISRSRGC